MGERVMDVREERERGERGERVRDVREGREKGASELGVCERGECGL